MKPIVLVTRPEFDKAAETFGACGTLHVIAVPAAEPELAAAVREHAARAVIVGVQPYRGPLYAALAQSSGGDQTIVARFGVGHDSIDKDQARHHKVVVTNTPGALDSSVAEHTMWLIGCLTRHVADAHRAMQSGRWEAAAGIELRGRILGILGFGAIGRRVASIAGLGFGMRVLAAGRTTYSELQQREGSDFAQLCGTCGVSQYTTDPELLFAESDVLSVHLPANTATTHFVNAARLARMKPSALLVNTARGSIVDEDALYDVLSAGRLAGAALDVYEHEPYRPRTPGRDLRTLNNVVLTPHMGSNTCAANHAMARLALDNVAHFMAGRLNRLNRVGT